MYSIFEYRTNFEGEAFRFSMIQLNFDDKKISHFTLTFIAAAAAAVAQTLRRS